MVGRRMTKALIIGAGPSLQENLDNLKKLGKFPGYVICTDGAINTLLKNGIIPDHVTTLEDTMDLDKYYTTDTVKANGKLIKSAIISDRVHPNARNAMTAAGLKIDIAGKIRGYITSNVGLFSYLIGGLILGCNEVYLIGMDHCYPRGQGPPVERGSELFKYGFNVMINKYNDEEIILHPAFMLWQEEFDWYSKEHPEIKVVNMTGRGALFAEQFIWKPIKDIKSWDEV